MTNIRSELNDPTRRKLLISGAAGLGWLATGPRLVQASECILTSTQIVGPYYLEEAERRRDVRDGRPGADLLLRLKIVDADTCQPIMGAVAEIWSCDALGKYSGYPEVDPNSPPILGRRSPSASDGPDLGTIGRRSSERRGGFGLRVQPTGPKRFLRGNQVADSDGKIEFLTIYPGWYAPRAVHVHAKVHLEQAELFTTQFYFPEDLNRTIHQSEPYIKRHPSPYTNAADRTMRRGGSDPEGVWPAMTAEGSMQVGTLTVGVTRP